MEKGNSFQIIKTRTVLSEKEQSECRVLLKDILKQKGIISLCLDSENLFMEFNQKYLNTDKIYLMLYNLGFTLDKEIKSMA